VSYLTHRARLLLSASLWLATQVAVADAGLLDTWLARKPPTPNLRGQSPAVADETGFCSDCDRTPNARHRERARNFWGHTYYPSIPPYCAPCHGVYPTCWRRLEECWSCPQERFATKPKRRSEVDPLGDKPGIPPLPPAGAPYIPSEPGDAAGSPPPTQPEPLSPTSDQPTIKTPSDEPATDAPPAIESPAAPQSRTRSDRVQPASAVQPAANPAVSKPAPATVKARSKSVEELIRELR